MKKITYLFLLFTGCLFAQISDEQKHLEKIKQIEEEVKAYAIEHKDEIVVPENFLQGLKEEGLSKKEQKSLIKEYKTTQLRKAFFVENPDLVSAYESSYLLNMASSCANGNFESGSAGYSFFQHAYSGSNGEGFDDCEMDINTNIPIALGPTNNITAQASLVTPGVDPILAGLSPSINLQRTNGGMGVRLNSNSGGIDITTMVKDGIIAEDEFIFNFAMVLENPTGHGNKQPFFEVRVYDENDNLFDSYCVIADENDCIFIDATPTQSNKILYSEWSCAKINTAPLSGQSIRVEFSVADCGAGGHFGYVYIDDVCDESCDSPAFKYINLDPLNTPEPCPEFPIQVCGEFDAPLAGTPQEGQLVDIRLYIIEDGQIVGSLSPSMVDPNTGIFCFTVDESDFPSPLIGDFDFSVQMDFQMSCNLDPYIYTLTDTATNNFGSDISCALWPRTYGGGDNPVARRFVEDIAVDGEDNVYTVGSLWENNISHEDSSFLTNNDDCFLMKHDAFGNLEWIKYMGASFSASLEENRLEVTANDKLIVIIGGTLYGFNPDGTPYFTPYPGIHANRLTINRDTGEIYIIQKFYSTTTTPDYTITDPGLGVFKFSANGTYQSHIMFSDGGQMLGIAFSETQNKLFISGRTESGTTSFSSGQTITGAYFGAEFDTSGSNITFSAPVVSFGNHIGLLEFDDESDELYVVRSTASISNLYVFSTGFSGNSNLVYTTSELVGGLCFDQEENVVYVASGAMDAEHAAQNPTLYNHAIAKVKNSGLFWEKPLPSAVSPQAIAKGVGDFIYIGGHYYGTSSLGAFPLDEYSQPNSWSIFKTRMKDLGNDAIFAKPSGQEETLAVAEVEKDTQFTIYPNPTESQLIVEAIENLPRNTRVSVVDLQGRSVKVTEKEVMTPQTALNVEHLVPGVYILKIISEEDSTAEYHRFIKE